MQDYQNIYQSAREGANLTQEAAAERLGWSVRCLQDIEQEIREPSPEKVAAMATLYRAPWLRGFYCNRCPLGHCMRRPESNVELQQLALEVELEAADYEQERRDAHDLARIALDRKIDDAEYPRYQAIEQRMLRRAYLSEMALIAGETQVER
ncbi:helix-turn-helix transcriptional regulator [Agathobaculum sp. NTUH-O15-33]|uniref:helix-turn-helix domain-containing protein n=1 Tax=Agathobaculum sp. NTUH-O15-33 TaxID=3079302 RepID=UPI002958CA54|nr:helix-turn-helix transcriptional regulator [Agathobaculum sp. NTUH-O15-33]WNX85762.1 helix-turn-helix transcriptional regulator [Agathobaculum sp. NTUH-O15-33]